MLDERTKDLVAIGASVTANCQPCLDHHVASARNHGVSDEDISAAVEVGKQVRRGAGAAMDKKIVDVLAKAVSACAPSGCGCG